MLTLEDLSVHFPIRRSKKVVKAVNEVSLDVPAGASVGLVGESGSGKTTVGKAALRLVDATSGRILIDGEDVTALPRGRQTSLRRKAQLVFQDPHSALNPRMTIAASVAEPLKIHTDLSGEAMRERVTELMETVGLKAQFLYRYPHELSGGQKQRVCIARALALNPKLLVLDEPTSALDVSVQAQILDFLRKLQSELSLTYLFISHNLAVVRHVSQRVAVMYLGRIVEEGPTETVFADPAHPYTKALLASVPLPQAVQPEKAAPVKGDIPSPVDLPPGCGFASRCPARIGGTCETVPPPVVEAGAGRTVRCHLFA
ncbi:MAG: ABC transporter ATP-binding protein [Pseudomonadota bacterium]